MVRRIVRWFNNIFPRRLVFGMVLQEANERTTIDIIDITIAGNSRYVYNRISTAGIRIIRTTVLRKFERLR